VNLPASCAHTTGPIELGVSSLLEKIVPADSSILLNDPRKLATALDTENQVSSTKEENSLHAVGRTSQAPLCAIIMMCNSYVSYELDLRSSSSCQQSSLRQGSYERLVVTVRVKFLMVCSVL
jgi:hypothetical protein